MTRLALSLLCCMGQKFVLSGFPGYNNGICTVDKELHEGDELYTKGTAGTGELWDAFPSFKANLLYKLV